MENIFKYRANKARARSEPKRRNELSPEKDVKLHDEMAKVSRKRAKNWAKQRLYDRETKRVLDEGLDPIVDIKNSSFRTTPRGQFTGKETMICGNYIPEKERAQRASQSFQQSHLEFTPFKTRNDFLMILRRKEREIGPDMRFGFKTEKERREHHLNGPYKLLDTTLKDNSMLSSPRWKSDDKSKWIDKRKGFDVTACNLRGTKSPWSVVATGINHGDKYVEGFDIMGDRTRKRIRHLEISTNEFSTTIGPNPNSSLPATDSVSLRTQLYLNYLNRDESKNKKFYPKTMKHVVTNISIEKETAENDDAPPTNTSRGRLIQLTSSMPVSPIKNSIPDQIIIKHNKKLPLVTNLSQFSGDTTPREIQPMKKRLPKLLPLLKRNLSIEERVNDYFTS